jgi:protein O-GlcNAc transferase
MRAMTARIVSVAAMVSSARTGLSMEHGARILGLSAAGVALAAQLLLAAQAPAARATDLYERALELERRGNTAAALSLLWEASGLAPHDGVIQNHLGEALERIGALDAAVEAFRAAADARPAPRGASNNLVLALVKGGRSAEASARARALTVEAPNDADRWFTLGLAQADVDVDGAIDSFHRALAIDRRHALARYNLGLVLYHADRLQPALDELHEALAIQPRPQVHYTLGIVYWHQGDLDRAAKALGDAVAANPDYADAHLALGTVFKARGELKPAASALRRAIALRPDLPAPHVVLAQTLALVGDQAGAQRESQEADRLRERSQRSQEAATWTAVGAQKLDAGDAAAATDCFHRATQAFDGFAPAHYQLGRALERLGQHDAARAAFARAQQLNPALVPPR